MYEHDLRSIITIDRDYKQMHAYRVFQNDRCSISFIPDYSYAFQEIAILLL